MSGGLGQGWSEPAARDASPGCRVQRVWRPRNPPGTPRWQPLRKPPVLSGGHRSWLFHVSCRIPPRDGMPVRWTAGRAPQCPSTTKGLRAGLHDVRAAPAWVDTARLTAQLPSAVCPRKRRTGIPPVNGRVAGCGRRPDLRHRLVAARAGSPFMRARLSMDNRHHGADLFRSGFTVSRGMMQTTRSEVHVDIRWSVHPRPARGFEAKGETS